MVLKKGNIRGREVAWKVSPCVTELPQDLTLAKPVLERDKIVYALLTASPTLLTASLILVRTAERFIGTAFTSRIHRKNSHLDFFFLNQ